MSEEKRSEGEQKSDVSIDPPVGEARPPETPGLSQFPPPGHDPAADLEATARRTGLSRDIERWLSAKRR